MPASYATTRADWRIERTGPASWPWEIRHAATGYVLAAPEVVETHDAGVVRTSFTCFATKAAAEAALDAFLARGGRCRSRD